MLCHTFINSSLFSSRKFYPQPDPPLVIQDKISYKLQIIEIDLGGRLQYLILELLNSACEKPYVSFVSVFTWSIVDLISVLFLL